MVDQIVSSNLFSKEKEAATSVSYAPPGQLPLSTPVEHVLLEETPAALCEPSASPFQSFSMVHVSAEATMTKKCDSKISLTI